MAKTKGTDVAVINNNSALPAHLQSKMEQHAGAGTSQAAEDTTVPMISVLQPLSPQVVDSRGEKFIKGSKAGDILVKNMDPPIIDGEEGIVFQPCYYHRLVVEWVPRDNGGGFVAHHAEMPEDAVERTDPNGKKRWIRPNGNECIDTRYHTGHLVDENKVLRPYVIPLTSSGHQVSRTWHTMMNSVRLPNGEIPPAFARLYRLKTVSRTKNGKTWFTFDISSEGWANEAQFDHGLALYQSMVAGEKKVSTEDEAAPAGAGDERAPF